MNLYKVINGIGEFYSIGKDYGEAQYNVEDILNKEDYGFSTKRKTLKIELVAAEFPENNFPRLITKK